MRTAGRRKGTVVRTTLVEPAHLNRMTVRTLLFARYRDLAGTDAVEVELPESATARDLVARLRASGGGWERIPPEPVIAVNMTYAALDSSLRHGDEVALIPPVSGG
jgi:molybdopterin converting factor subunit 1